MAGEPQIKTFHKIVKYFDTSEKGIYITVNIFYQDVFWKNIPTIIFS